MTSLVTIAVGLATALHLDVPPEGPFENDSDSSMLIPVLGGVVVALIVAFVVVAIVLIRKQR